MGQLDLTTAQVQQRLDREYSKAAGTGLKVDEANPDFPWVDLIGTILPNTENHASAPKLKNFREGIKAYKYDVGKELACIFHIPHDWTLNRDAKLHVHWGHNGTSISGNVEFDGKASYADRDGVFVEPVNISTITFNTVNIATTPQYNHFVTEVDLFTETPTANQINRSLVQVDGVVPVTVSITTHPTIEGYTSGNDIGLFIFCIDLHYQTTGQGTKNNAAPFYD